MLVLSRRPGQKVIVPALGMTVTVLAVKGNSIRIGIEAPPDVTVIREELLEHGPAGRAEPASLCHHAACG